MRNRVRARRIKLILMDVDGTLTDGSLAVLPDGEEIKAYNVKDGLGVLLAQLIDLKLGIITGKRSQGLVRRAERLKITELHQGVIDKKPVFDDILKRHGLAPEETAYIGDDIGDLEIMAAAGLAAAPADAHKLVKKQAHYVCRLAGGRGAFRELVDFIIDAQGKRDLIAARFKCIFDRKI
jgi:3-deoxy-D-manno-octulosonate 8-phosphate phosphatase (KDO 8-P phosphatase)